MLIQLVYAIPIAGEKTPDQLKKVNAELPDAFELRDTGNNHAHKLLLCLKEGDTFVTDGKDLNPRVQPYISLNEWPRHHSLVVYHSVFGEAHKVLDNNNLAIPTGRHHLWEWYLVTNS